MPRSCYRIDSDINSSRFRQPGKPRAPLPFLFTYTQVLFTRCFSIIVTRQLPSVLLSLPLQLVRKPGNLFEKVSNQSDVRDLEDRRVAILIDGGNDLAILHACQVLYGP